MPQDCRNVLFVQLFVALQDLVSFVKSYLKRFPYFYPSIINKKIRFNIINYKGNEISVTMEIGSGKLINNKEKVNKEFKIKNNLFKAVLDKKIIFENLYTGYESEIYRNPIEEYNRDIILYLDMFGYKYKRS